MSNANVIGWTLGLLIIGFAVRKLDVQYKWRLFFAGLITFMSITKFHWELFFLVADIIFSLKR